MQHNHADVDRWRHRPTHITGIGGETRGLIGTTTRTGGGFVTVEEEEEEEEGGGVAAETGHGRDGTKLF